MRQGAKVLTNRRNFLVSAAATAGLVLYPEALLFGQAASNTSTPPPTAPSTTPQTSASNTAGSKPRPDPLKPELVKEFVMAAHVDLEKTKALLAETPALLNATWDWGGGDFEMDG